MTIHGNHNILGCFYPVTNVHWTHVILFCKLLIKIYKKKFGLNFESFSHLTPCYEGLRIQILLKNFLCGLETCSDHVTTSPDFRLYNDTKSMAVGPLEKIGHLFLNKLQPHLPFESYFSISKKLYIWRFPKRCYITQVTPIKCTLRGWAIFFSLNFL